jgi:hypothetical protein
MSKVKVVKMRPLYCALVPASSECNRDTRVFASLEKALAIYGKAKRVFEKLASVLKER